MTNRTDGNERMTVVGTVDEWAEVYAALTYTGRALAQDPASPPGYADRYEEMAKNLRSIRHSPGRAGSFANGPES